MIEIEKKSTQFEKQHGDASNEYSTQLHLAVKDNNLRYIQTLIEDGVPVLSIDKFGRTPLHWAIVFDHQKVACALIINTPKSGLDLQDNYGCTPLHYAALGGRTNIGRILLERGASINSIDSRQRTPLHYAAQSGKPGMVEMLVSRGAEKNCLDCKGYLPFDIAIEWGSFSSLVCLRGNSLSKIDKTSNSKDLENVDFPKVKTNAHQNKNMSKDLVENDQLVLKKRSPSLDKLMSAWKNIQYDAKTKRELEAKWIAKATIILEDKLEQWKEAEQEAKQRKHEVWSFIYNSLSDGCSWKSESSNIARYPQIYGNITHQPNDMEHTSSTKGLVELFTIPQNLSNPSVFSYSPSFYSMSSSPLYKQDFTPTLPLALFTPNIEIMSSNLLTPKSQYLASSNVGSLSSSTPIVGASQATFDENQNLDHDPKSIVWTPICPSNSLLPQTSSTSLLASITTSKSPNLYFSISKDVLSDRDRLWWCRESNSNKVLSTIEQSGDPSSTNIGGKNDALQWCTEWEVDSPETTKTREEAQQVPRKMQVLLPNTTCDKRKGKEKVVFDEEPTWVQVWPKKSPSSSSSCVSTPFGTMTSV